MAPAGVFPIPWLDLAEPGTRVGELFDVDELAQTGAGRLAFARLPLETKVAALLAVPPSRWGGPVWNFVLDTLTDPRIDDGARHRLAAHRRRVATRPSGGAVHVRTYDQTRAGREVTIHAHERSPPRPD